MTLPVLRGFGCWGLMSMCGITRTDVAVRRGLPLGQFCAHPGRGSAHAGLPRDRKRDAGNPFCDLRAKHAHCRFSESVDQAATNGVTGDDQPWSLWSWLASRVWLLVDGSDGDTSVVLSKILLGDGELPGGGSTSGWIGRVDS